MKRSYKTLLSFMAYCLLPIKVYADYSGRHYNSSSADLLLISAFIVILVIALVLFISNSGKKSIQVKETIKPKQTPNFVPKVDIKNSTIVLVNVSALLKKANRSSYIYSELVNFSSFSLSKRNDIQKAINKGACDAAREYKDLFTLVYYKEKRNYFSPPIEYSDYYELAYETVISDPMKLFQIKHDIETGLIQCE